MNGDVRPGPGWGATPDDYPAPSQCMVCAHAIEGGPYCRAFLGGIPAAFMLNRIDHRSPVEFDGGTQFVPAADAEPAALARLYSYLDSLRLG